jgi:hypothetical protein
MTKPLSKFKNGILDWIKVQKYFLEKYGININNVSGPDWDGVKTYYLSFFDVGNGYLHIIYDPSDCEEDDLPPEWIVELEKKFFDEFQEYVEDGQLAFHVYW